MDAPPIRWASLPSQTESLGSQVCTTAPGSFTVLKHTHTHKFTVLLTVKAATGARAMAHG